MFSNLLTLLTSRSIPNSHEPGNFSNCCKRIVLLLFTLHFHIGNDKRSYRSCTGRALQQNLFRICLFTFSTSCFFDFLFYLFYVFQVCLHAFVFQMALHRIIYWITNVSLLIWDSSSLQCSRRKRSFIPHSNAGATFLSKLYTRLQINSKVFQQLGIFLISPWHCRSTIEVWESAKLLHQKV